MLCLKEGSSHKVPFSVSCYPPLEASKKHMLLKDDVSVSEGRICVEENSVHFHEMKLSDAGEYTLSSTNPAGQGKGSFSLRVKREYYDSGNIALLRNLYFWVKSMEYIDFALYM